MKISELRKQYHEKLCADVIRIEKTEEGEFPNFADRSSKSSTLISREIVELLGFPKKYGREKEQTVGDLFEEITREFIENSFNLLMHIRPGNWMYSTKQTEISRFEQYEHLARIAEKIKGDKDLSTALGRDYLVKPDIIIAQYPISDLTVNEKTPIILPNDDVSKLTPLRIVNNKNPSAMILHASISCKWTIRSDRSQNTRTEALNLIRNRKGNLPHIVAVTAEPLPMRIATLALGTGDLDCVYHFALNELRQSVAKVDNDDQKEMLDCLINGKRLRDISDLPFDIAI